MGDLIEKNSINIFEWYLKAFKYNLESLKRFKEINELFYDIIKTNISIWSEQLNLAEEAFKKSEIDMERIIEPNFEPNPYDTPREALSDLYPEMTYARDTILEQGDFNIALMYDQPISLLKHLSAENIERLNLYGIHTVNDLKESTVPELSQNTGISKTQLYNIRRQIQ